MLYLFIPKSSYKLILKVLISQIVEVLEYLTTLRLPEYILILLLNTFRDRYFVIFYIICNKIPTKIKYLGTKVLV